jgi:hypothetical protein
MLEPIEWFGPEEMQKNTGQSSLFLVLPNERQKGWAAYHDRVLFIIKDECHKFRVRTGFINSTPNTHVDVDNVTKVVVWSDIALCDADDVDDAHEKSFAVNDPMLIKLEEVQLICNGRVLKEWFKGILSPHEIVQIQHLLKLSDFGRASELTEIAQRDRPSRLLQQLFSSWWQRFHCPIPLQPRQTRFWGQ